MGCTAGDSGGDSVHFDPGFDLDSTWIRPRFARSTQGFERRTVRGQRYPGIVACAGAHVDGAVIRGLTDAQLASLDHYEGDV